MSQRLSPPQQFFESPCIGQLNHLQHLPFRRCLFVLAWVCLIFFGHSSPTQAQSTDALADYSTHLAELAQSLEDLLEDACCEPDGSANYEKLAAGYQAVFQQASQTEIDATDNTSDFSATALLNEEVVTDLDSAVDLPELEAEVNAAIARLRLVADQLNKRGNDQVDSRMATLESVLARPEFRTQLTLWERFIRWLNGLIERYLPQSEGEGDGFFAGAVGRLVGWTLAIVGAIAAAYLLSYWIQRLVGGFVNNASLNQNVWADDDFPLSAREARAQAAKEAQSGNYRGAVRRLYLAALLTMEEQGTIRYDRSQTNREVLAQVAEDDALTTHLRPVIETFDDVWYGVHEPDKETYNEYTQEVDQLTQSTEESASSTSRLAPASGKRSTSIKARGGR